MLDTAVPTLKPLSTGQILDRGIRLYRHHFLTFVGIIAIAQIPSTLLNIIAGYFFPAAEIDPTAAPFDIFFDSMTQSFGIGSFWVVLGIFIISVILSLLGSIALTNAVTQSYLARPLGIIESYRKIGRSFLSAIGAYFLAGLALIAIMVWWFVVPIFGWISGFGIFLYFLMVVVPFIVPAIVVENQPASQVIQRAWDLSRKRFWWLVGFMLLLGLFGQIVVTVPALLFAGLLQTLVASSVDASTLRIGQQIISLLLNLIYVPLQLTCVILLYFDARVRSEGLDLALEAIDPESDAYLTETKAVFENPPPQKSGLWPTWLELAYFMLFSAGAFVLCGVIYGIIIVVSLIIFSGSLGGF